MMKAWRFGMTQCEESFFFCYSMSNGLEHDKRRYHSNIFTESIMKKSVGVNRDYLPVTSARDAEIVFSRYLVRRRN